MVKKRIIPALLLKSGGMVKGKQFSQFRDVGNPVTAARVYQAQKVDELIFLDIEPNEQSQKRVKEIIREVASECFMPLCVGGGISSLDGIKGFLDVGADKVSINTHAFLNPRLVQEGAEQFGDQCIVVSVDYRMDPDGSRRVWIESVKRATGKDAMEHVERVVALGAGELLITCIDREGMMQGYDLDFLKEVTQRVGVPVIASGGAGKLDDFSLAFTQAGVSAVSAGSIFHFTDQSPIKARYYLTVAGIGVRV